MSRNNETTRTVDAMGPDTESAPVGHSLTETSGRAPGKRMRTQGLSAATAAVQRKESQGSPTAALPDDGWTYVAYRPDVFSAPSDSPIQRKADSTSATVEAGGTPATSPEAPRETGSEAPLENPTTQEVETAIDTGQSAAVVLQKIAELAAQHPGWPQDCWNNVAVMVKIHNALSGDQMLRAFQLMGMPPDNDQRPLTRFNWIAPNATQASPQTFRAIFATASPAALDVALANDVVNVWLTTLAGTDPLTFFTHLQTGLTAAAATNQSFCEWMVQLSTPDQILRALAGTAAPVLTTMAGHFNAIPTGWAWLDTIDGTRLSPADHAALAGLRAVASPAGQTKIDAITSAVGPAAPLKAFADRMTDLRTAAAPANQILALIQQGTTVERLALLDDAPTATFIHTQCTGHPLQVYAVTTAERAQFMVKPAFLTIVLDRLPWGEALPLVSDRSYIDAVGPVLDTISGDMATWLGTMPASNSMSASEQMSVRALRLVIANAGNKITIFNHFGDSINPDIWATQAAAPVTATALENPLQSLDTLLAQPAPSGQEIVSMCGAAGADRQTIAADPVRMASIRAKTSNEEFYQALFALRMSLGDQITQLGLKGQSGPRIHSLINEADALSLGILVRNDAAVLIVKSQLPSQPLNLLRYDAPGALPADTMDYTEFRTWVLDATNPTQLVSAVAGTDALAAQFAAKFDARGWGWITRLPDGAALLPDERAGLDRLRARTAKPDAKRDIAAKLGDKTDVAVDAPTALGTLKTELAKPAASPATCLRLVTQLTDPAHKQDIITNHKADALRIFDDVQLGRFIMSLGLTLANQMVWMNDKGTATPATLQMLLARAGTADKIALFDDAQAITLLQGLSELGPVRAMGGMDAATLGGVAAKQRFWQWYVAKERPLELVHTVVGTAQVPVSIATIKTAALLNTFDELPRGTGLPPRYRGYVDQIMHGANDGDAQKKMFVARFGLSLTGDWTVTTPDDLLRLYDELASLPIAHVSNDKLLQIMNRHHAGGGTYDEGNRTANIGAATGTDETFYNGKAGQYTEKYFDHTVRHEVGHGVDALMGGKTDIVFNQAQWKEYPQSQLDDWLTSMNAWDPSGGPAPSAAEKQQIRDLIQEYVQAGGATIAGPSQPAMSLAGASHPWRRFPHVRVVREMDRNTTGLGYKNRYSGGGKVFSINYYYKRFMECSVRAGASAPRDYTMFAPSEWFADMYAEFYRSFDGVDDSKLGGNCPAWVKQWYLNNVHKVGGRTPHSLTGVQVPETKRVNH